ncbi:MAG: c-type cytochrome [Nitrospiraceae bacterium]
MKKALWLSVGLAGCLALPLWAAEQHERQGMRGMEGMMQPRVPADKLAEARALASPLSDSAEVVERGKALYEGKGTCFTCHGLSGRGDGPAGATLNPSPRNFHHRGFWRHRTEGEIFWVIKNGSPGTGMIPFGGALTDDEIWGLIQYLRTFSGNDGPRRGMGPSERMGHSGPRGSMGSGAGGGPVAPGGECCPP